MAAFTAFATFAYPFLLGRVTADIARCLHARNVAIDAGGTLALGHLLLTGSTGRVRMTAASVRLDGFTLRDLTATATDVHVSRWGLITGSPSATAGSLTARVTVTEGDLTGFLRAHGLPLLARLGPDGIDLGAQLGRLPVADLHGTVSTGGDGRDIVLTMTPSLLPRQIDLRLPATIATASLPTGYKIGPVSLGRGSATITLRSTTPTHLSSCPN